MKKVGIIGGGQLGRMLAIAGKKLGLYTVVLDPTPQSPAGQVADFQIVADFKDESKIKEIADQVDYITFEIESANSEALQKLVESGKDINPLPTVLGIIKDKYFQKKFLEKNNIPVAESMEVFSEDDIINASIKFGYPILLKAKKDAYDGRGNALIENESDIQKALTKLQGRELYVEKFVPFKKELAVVIARDQLGNVSAFPTVETIHKNNICHMVISPAGVTDSVIKRAEDMASRVISALGGIGVFGVEMFLLPNEEILINEIAPRVHNSGHHTIEAHNVSQFEQHMRAISRLPIISVESSYPFSVMINILGERSGSAEPIGVEDVQKIEGVHVHLYGKSETRPERKMGHITVVGSDLNEVMEKAKLARLKISI